MQEKEFTGHSSEMRKDTPWLASEDIMGRGDVEVTIAGVQEVRQAEFEDGRKKDVFALSFEGKKKRLVMNATNRRTLVARFGPNVTNWKGKRIVLYVKEGIRVGSELKPGIRIRGEERP